MHGEENPEPFDPLERLEWTVTTEVEGIDWLVRNRELVWERHRKIVDPTCSGQANSYSALSNLFKCEPDAAAAFPGYIDFCRTVNQPVFPLTVSTITLYIVARCSHLDGDYEQIFNGLDSIRMTTKYIWDGLASRIDLLESDMKTFKTARAFLEERKMVQASISRDRALNQYSLHQSPAEDQSHNPPEVSGSNPRKKLKLSHSPDPTSIPPSPRAATPFSFRSPLELSSFITPSFFHTPLPVSNPLPVSDQPPAPASPLYPDFYSELEASLDSLHPSLTSLASPLFAAGINSIDTLHVFSSFEPSTFEIFLNSIREKAQAEGQSFSEEQITLFSKLVRTCQWKKPQH
ncbi:hypothetical protein JCM3765_001644 [Sporobolomyces pararoseus]